MLGEFARRQGQLTPPARARLAGAIAAGWPISGRRLASPNWTICSSCTASKGSGVRAPWHREGRRRRRRSPPGSARAGTSSGCWPSARPARGLDSFASDELPDFAARYREVAADLARARTYGVDDATLQYLERLAAAGHNALYRQERGTWRRMWEVLARECPAAIRQAGGYVLIACLTFMLPATAGFW